MTTDSAGIHQLLDRLVELDASCTRHNDGPWEVVREPHSYPDGTTHFTHVRYIAHLDGDSPVSVRIASHVTPDLGELLVLMKNNLPELIRLARRGLAH